MCLDRVSVSVSDIKIIGKTNNTIAIKRLICYSVDLGNMQIELPLVHEYTSQQFGKWHPENLVNGRLTLGHDSMME